MQLKAHFYIKRRRCAPACACFVDALKILSDPLSTHVCSAGRGGEKVLSVPQEKVALGRSARGCAWSALARAISARLLSSVGLGVVPFPRRRFREWCCRRCISNCSFVRFSGGRCRRHTVGSEQLSRSHDQGPMRSNFFVAPRAKYGRARVHTQRLVGLRRL